MTRPGYSDEEWENLQRVANCKFAITKCIGEHDERRLDIWIAALTEQLKRFAELQLLDQKDD